MTNESPTNEELLRKVIEAQVKGGCKTFSMLTHARIGNDGYVDYEISLLNILLDTEGCKAAYGENVLCEECWWNVGEEEDHGGQSSQRFVLASEDILHSWHEGSGNNARAALEAAVSLLPKSL